MTGEGFHCAECNFFGSFMNSMNTDKSIVTLKSHMIKVFFHQGKSYDLLFPAKVSFKDRLRIDYWYWNYWNAQSLEIPWTSWTFHRNIYLFISNWTSCSHPKQEKNIIDCLQDTGQFHFNIFGTYSKPKQYRKVYWLFFKYVRFTIRIHMNFEMHDTELWVLFQIHISHLRNSAIFLCNSTFFGRGQKLFNLDEPNVSKTISISVLAETCVS